MTQLVKIIFALLCLVVGVLLLQFGFRSWQLGRRKPDAVFQVERYGQKRPWPPPPQPVVTDTQTKLMEQQSRKFGALLLVIGTVFVLVPVFLLKGMAAIYLKERKTQ